MIVTGHTCSLGEPAYNTWLGEQRALAVKEILSSHGLSAARIRTRSVGASAPLAQNDSGAGRQQNRRVTLQCLPSSENGEQ